MPSSNEGRNAGELQQHGEKPQRNHHRHEIIDPPQILSELLISLLFDLSFEEVDPGIEFDHFDIIECLRCLGDSGIGLLHKCLLESRASSGELDVYENADNEDSDSS